MNNESGIISEENIALSSKYTKPLFIKGEASHANPFFENLRQSVDLLNYHHANSMCNTPKEEKLVLNPRHSSSQNLSLYSRHLKTGTTGIINRNDDFNHTKVTQKESYTIQHNKVTFNSGTNVGHCQQVHEQSGRQTGTDKATYCRPVRNLYDQQFLYKTVEKNARLQRLVRELTKARQREKEIENWNKYINDLRRKHGKVARMGRAVFLQYVPEVCNSEIIQDYDNTNFKYTQTNFCHYLLDMDFNDSVSDTRLLGSIDERTRNLCKPYPCPFEANQICYPTSSHGRYIVLEKERQNRLKNWVYKPLYADIKDKNVINRKYPIQNNLKSINEKRTDSGKIGFILNNRGTNMALRSSDTQTEHQLFPEMAKVVCKNISTDVPHNTKLVQINMQSSENVLKQISLSKIEEKLDNLIRSIDNFMVEIKTKKCTRPDKKGDSELEKENLIFTKSDSCGIATKEKIVCGLLDDASKSSMNSTDMNTNTINHIGDNLKDINDIILKTIHKNKLITLKDSSVGDTYHPCSVQISVTIPTKDISTEVTKSLSKAAYHSQNEKNVLQETVSPVKNDTRIAIAVNTEPISLLAFLKVSTEETLRKLLAFVPTIDYYYYLSRLHAPQARVNESHFICSICGCEFSKPSQLTDHIRSHELGRDCCVCRHVLEMPRRPPGIFKCQYCGKRFTRAYCCELHQQSCARRLGVAHDISSNLLLLR